MAGMCAAGTVVHRDETDVRKLLIDYWMGHSNSEISVGHYGKRLLDHMQWRQECAAKVGLGFTLPKESNEPLLDKSGQVFSVETEGAVLA
jgi:hypothetical protein